MTTPRIAILMLLPIVAAACGGDPSEDVGQSSSDLTSITSTCVKPGNDPAAVLPKNATWPLGSQDVYCEDMPVETAQRTWPAGISRCPANNANPGTRQVDVWLADDAAPTNYYCSRVTLGAVPANFVLDYEPFLEMGWLSQSLNPARTRQMFGAYIGPGAGAVIESRATANPLGCSEPVSGCISTQVAAGGSALWVPVNNAFKADAINFY